MRNKAPIFFWASFFLIGSSHSLYPHWIYLVPIFLLTLVSKHKVQGLIFLIAGYTFTYYQCPMPDFEQVQGEGIFCLESIHPSSSPFSKTVSLKGRMTIFQTDTATFYNIPCIIFQPRTLREGSRWYLKGQLEKRNNLIFKPQKHIPWKMLKAPPTLARWRFNIKEHLRTLMQKKAKGRAAHFLSSIITGDPSDRLLSMEFRKVGLSHVLAISGFHFALVALTISSFLKCFMSRKSSYYILLFILVGYLVFLGPSPSIIRAFIMISFFILGKLLHRQIDVLNLLGLALFFELVQNPRVLSQLGFQLSFLATGGILLFYPHFLRLTERFFPKRPLNEVSSWPMVEKYGYLLSSTLRQAVALDVAVHCTTLPILLFFFHSFSFLSLPYNIIFPPLLGLSILFFPLAFFCPPFFYLHNNYTSWLLRLIASAPEALNFQIFIQSFPFPLLVLLTSAILTIGLTKRIHTR